MLLNFTFSNYKSFKEEQFFSMERPANIVFQKDSINTDKGKELSRVAAFYGANAAGKSNFLSAIECARDLIVGEKVDIDRYISTTEDPTCFSFTFIAKNNLKYNYTLAIKKDIIVDERLSIYKTNRPTNIFSYSKELDTFEIGNMFKDNEKTAIKFNFEKNPNQPVISQLQKSDSEDARTAFNFFKNDIFPSISNKLKIDINTSKLTHVLDENEEIHAFLNETLFAADLGIKSVNLVESESGANKEQQKILSKALIDFTKAGNPEISKEEIERLEKTSSIFDKIKKVIFEHEINGTKASFDIEKESDGTIAACGILLDLLPILSTGSVYIIDELDRSLHPSIMAQIIEIFNYASTNPNNAQLIFSTHDVSLLDSTIYGEDILDRDEVWFVEKNNDGCSQIYPLTDIKYSTRKEDNIYKKYVGGKYGATPRVSLSYIVELYWQKVKNANKE